MRRVRYSVPDSKVTIVFEVFRMVFDGSYIDSGDNLDLTDIHLLSLRFSFNTLENDYGYIAFEYILDNLRDAEKINYVKHNIFNKMLISDYGMSFRVISDLYKDNKGYYYICSHLALNDTYIKLYVPEEYTYMVDLIKMSLESDQGIPETDGNCLPGFGFNSNEISFIRNMITMNYIEEKKDRLKINNVYIDRRKSINFLDNTECYDYWLSCNIPDYMYSINGGIPGIAEHGLNLLINIKVPKSAHKRVYRRLRDIRKNIKDIPNDNSVYLLNPMIESYYYKDTKSKSKITRIVGVIIGSTYANNSYIKFNIVSNYMAFIDFFIDYLDIRKDL